MSKGRREALRDRRERLLAQAEAQREALSRLASGAEVPLRIAEAGIAIGHILFLRRRMYALGSAFAPGRARRLLFAASCLVAGWQVTRIVRARVREGRRARLRALDERPPRLIDGRSRDGGDEPPYGR